MKLNAGTLITGVLAILIGNFLWVKYFEPNI